MVLGEEGAPLPFSDEERARWHEEKRARETPPPLPRPDPVAVCVSCQLPFGINEGVVTEEAAMCDVCNGE